MTIFIVQSAQQRWFSTDGSSKMRIEKNLLATENISMTMKFMGGKLKSIYETKRGAGGNVCSDECTQKRVDGERSTQKNLMFYRILTIRFQIVNTSIHLFSIAFFVPSFADRDVLVIQQRPKWCKKRRWVPLSRVINKNSFGRLLHFSFFFYCRTFHVAILFCRVNGEERQNCTRRRRVFLN